MAADVLEHDDGVIDDASDGDHQPSKREDVQGDALPPQDEQRHDERKRDGHGSHQRCSSAAQEKEDDEDREERAEQSLSQDVADRVGDGNGLVEDGLELDAMTDGVAYGRARTLD